MTNSSAQPGSSSNHSRRDFAAYFLLLATLSAVEPFAAADEPAPQKPLVLAHYMPWFVAKPESDGWGWHWTMNHFDPEKSNDGKREIASHYYPLIGPYDSGDRHVIEYHLLLMKLAGIDGVIVDWYGRMPFRDYPVLHRNTTRVLQECERRGMKFVICYEDQTVPALVKAGKLKEERRVDHVVSEIDWLSKYWFKSGAYVRTGGKPLLLSFGHAGLSDDEWVECLADLATSVTYFSEHVPRFESGNAYDWPIPKEGLKAVERFAEAAPQRSDAIPVVFPRFRDVYREAGVSDGYETISDDDGNTLRSTLKIATRQHSRVVQIATWNDWGEGTQIEPSVEHGFRDLKIISRHVGGGTSVEDSVLKLPLRLLELRRAGNSKSVADEIAERIAAGDTEKALELLQAAEAAGKN